MNIGISIASETPESFIVREALSEYPFYRFTCACDSYTDMAKVTLTADDRTFEGTVSGMDISVDASGRLLYNAGAVDATCPDLDAVHPISFQDTPLSGIIKHYGFEVDGEDDLSAEMSILNTTYSDANMAIAIANLGNSPAFVDFTKRKVHFLNRLYSQEPIEVMAGFQATYSRPVSIGYVLSDPTATTYGGNASPHAVLQGGRPILYSNGVMRNLAKNYNDLAALWAKKQMFAVPDQDIPLGSMVISELTGAKRLVVAKESTYTARGARYSYWVV